jgi:hypothetical protein
MQSLQDINFDNMNSTDEWNLSYAQVQKKNLFMEDTFGFGGTLA